MQSGRRRGRNKLALTERLWCSIVHVISHQPADHPARTVLSSSLYRSILALRPTAVSSSIQFQIHVCLKNTILSRTTNPICLGSEGYQRKEFSKADPKKESRHRVATILCSSHYIQRSGYNSQSLENRIWLRAEIRYDLLHVCPMLSGADLNRVSCLLQVRFWSHMWGVIISNQIIPTLSPQIVSFKTEQTNSRRKNYESHYILLPPTTLW